MQNTIALPYFGYLTNKFWLKIILFTVIVGLSVFLKSAYLSFALFSLMIVWDRRFIIPSLLITPCIETVLIFTDELTITKLLTTFLTLFFVSSIILKNKKITLDWNTIFLILFFIVVFIGFVNTVFTSRLINADDAIRYNLFVSFPKVIFAFLIYIYLKQNGKDFFVNSLFTSIYAISLSLILIMGYFIFISHDTLVWRIVVTRVTFKGADPNEFAGMIIALGVFTVGMYYILKTKISSILAILILSMLSYSVVLTMSRGGMFTLFFLFFFCFILFLNREHKKTFFILISLLIILFLLISMSLMDIYALSERFYGIRISALEGRAELWLSGLKGFAERPFIGHGNSAEIAMIINDQQIERYNVSHSIYVEMLIRFGMFGFIVFTAILLRAIMPLWVFIKKKQKIDPILILPIISLVVLLVSGAFLSWQWRDILWFLIGISLVARQFILTRNFKRHRQR